MGVSKIIEFLLISWIYLWLAGFVIAIAVTTVRGYIEVIREARTFERSLWKG